jgi:hypothetical protein
MTGYRSDETKALPPYASSPASGEGLETTTTAGRGPGSR